MKVAETSVTSDALLPFAGGNTSDISNMSRFVNARFKATWGYRLISCASPSILHVQTILKFLAGVEVEEMS
jgi:hypothetical protein